MNVVTVKEVGWDSYDEFCHHNSTAWFFHTKSWMDYQRWYRGDLRPELDALAVVDGASQRLLGVLPLMTEDSLAAPGRREVSSGGGPGWGPILLDALGQTDRRDVIRLLLGEVDNVAEALGVWRGTLRLSPLCATVYEELTLWLTEFARAGWADVSLVSSVVDLTQTTEELWQRISKGHRSDIRRGTRLLSSKVDGGAGYCTERFACYRDLHRMAAGRVTRPDETFRLMEEWIRDGNGLLLTAFVGDQPVGCIYLLLYKARAYYASAANDPGFARLPIGHFLTWTAIEWLKSQGFVAYELGIQQFSPLPYDEPSPKEIAISRFKRHFGGELLPLVTRRKTFLKVPGP